jgi:hypothetical protein
MDRSIIHGSEKFRHPIDHGENSDGGCGCSCPDCGVEFYPDDQRCPIDKFIPLHRWIPTCDWLPDSCTPWPIDPILPTSSGVHVGMKRGRFDPHNDTVVIHHHDLIQQEIDSRTQLLDTSIRSVASAVVVVAIPLQE